MNSNSFPSFSRPWWLFNTHLETVWAKHCGTTPAFEREIIETFDSDHIALDVLRGNPEKPALVIFHGLEGCSRSHTIRHVASALNAKGWNIFVPHFRTCGIMNKLPRAYHAGDTVDADWMLRYCKASLPVDTTMYAMGISLGGNVLCKWLAENPEQKIVTAAAAICPPLDLELAAKRLDRFMVRKLYGNYFLKRLRDKISLKITKYPFLIKPKELARIRTIRDFDDQLTAPLHGFANASDYYRKASALPLLDTVATPLLLLHSANDALVPPPDLAGNSAITSLITKAGGHSGFVTPPFPGDTNWISQLLCSFFTPDDGRQVDQNRP